MKGYEKMLILFLVVIQNVCYSEMCESAGLENLMFVIYLQIYESSGLILDT
jgi:hypothetical protein